MEINKEKIKSFKINKEIFQTSENLYFYEDNFKNKVFKKFYVGTGLYYENEVKTIKYFLEYGVLFKKYLLNLVLPEYIVEEKKEAVGFIMPYVSGVGLNQYLNSEEIDVMGKINFLKKLGIILDKIKNIRSLENLENLFINDLHEDNFIVGDDGELYLIDIDSFKIIDNNPSPGKMLLAPHELLEDNNSKYYNVNKSFISYYEASENTDLFSYSICILNFLYGERVVHNFSINELNSYIDYLESLGMDNMLLDIFRNLYSKNDNINPYDNLNSISIVYPMSKKENYKNFNKSR